MTDTIASAVARERRLDLQRAAGCCTALFEHRRAVALKACRRFSPRLRRRPLSAPCCAWAPAPLSGTGGPGGP